MTNPEPLSPQSVSARRQSKPPGPRLGGFAALSIGVLVCLYYDWWPSRFGDLNWLDPLLCGGLALLVLTGSMLIWAIRTLYVLGYDRRWSWWIVPIPAVVLIAATTAALIPPRSFTDLRPQFEQVAAELLAGPETTRQDLEIGPIDIISVRETDDGVVYFIDADGAGYTNSSGWAYAPNGLPAPGLANFTWIHIDGPWYEITSTT
ncbi:DUF1109 domain-containing protein [Nocardia sp. GCM10030253]|uniref:DUF1109 domain-containing protein n=1 Tax=Nocardia sp. GCM10030253 TaxID=3273404 RepID=UPI003630891B